MGKRLFVGNMPYSVTEEQLTELFAEHGTVERVNIVSDRMSGRPKGFAFVDMADDAEAEAAIAALNGYMLGERELVVNEARPMEARPPRDNQGGGSWGNRSGGSRGGFGGGRDRNSGHGGGRSGGSSGGYRN
jgi:cold-inducible RNA-binding protein